MSSNLVPNQLEMKNVRLRIEISVNSTDFVDPIESAQLPILLAQKCLYKNPFINPNDFLKNTQPQSNQIQETINHPIDGGEVPNIFSFLSSSSFPNGPEAFLNNFSVGNCPGFLPNSSCPSNNPTVFPIQNTSEAPIGSSPFDYNPVTHIHISNNPVTYIQTITVNPIVHQEPQETHKDDHFPNPHWDFSTPGSTETMACIDSEMTQPEETPKIHQKPSSSSASIGLLAKIKQPRKKKAASKKMKVAQRKIELIESLGIKPKEADHPETPGEKKTSKTKMEEIYKEENDETPKTETFMGYLMMSSSSGSDSDGSSDYSLSSGESDGSIQKEVQILSNVTKEKRAKRGNYNNYSVETKEKAISDAKRHGLKKAAIMNKISKKNLKRWVEKGSKRKKGGGRIPTDPIMEQMLMDWMKDFMISTDGRLPTPKFIREKSKVLSQKKEKFRASKGWCEKFLKRFLRNYLGINGETSQESQV